jgi:4-diphosphocytidyl-2C-methyl-D-erythritol kinase
MDATGAVAGQPAVSAASVWPAPAKLNLFLHIVGRRADGYHLLQTVFQLVDLYDDIAITPRTDGVMERLGGLAHVPPAQDLVVRAALAWATVEKRRIVPACSYVDTFVRRHPEFQTLL